MNGEVRTNNPPSMAWQAGLGTVCRPGRRLHRFFRRLFELAVLLALAFVCYLLISRFFVSSVQVVGQSMTPTLHDAEHLLLNRWIYCLHAPKAGDIVVFHDPLDNALAIKRVIGVPGDLIDFQHGHVFRNGRKLSEPYLSPETPTFPYMRRRTQSFFCDEGHYLVLGDNRKNSADSRTYGLIARQEILGRVVR
jgi:signal peptidase I